MKSRRSGGKACTMGRIDNLPQGAPRGFDHVEEHVDVQIDRQFDGQR